MGNKKKVEEIHKGYTYEMSDCVYNQLLVLSEKRTVVTNGISRECVAWNLEQCRRYDITEQEISKLKLIAQLDMNYVDEYVMGNKANEWDNPKSPIIKEGK